MANNTKGIIRKGKTKVAENGTLIPDITPIKIIVSEPEGPEPTEMTKDDVWGKWDEEHNIRVKDGMIVAHTGDICPIFGDKVPYKSVTVVCKEEEFESVKYWLEYVHGYDCISKMKEMEENKIAIRSEYQCW